MKKNGDFKEEIKMKYAMQKSLLFDKEMRTT